MTLVAQTDVTQFLGIPVDGTKNDMMKKLLEKGFRRMKKNDDFLTGQFNGKTVSIHIVTNNGKVYRLMVANQLNVTETVIKNEFNTLCKQFDENKKYVCPTFIDTYIIPEEENISYQMTVKNKRYQALFYQKTSTYDSLIIEGDTLIYKDTLSKKEEERLDVVIAEISNKKLQQKKVWFVINEILGKYYIVIYYDNTLNQPNGEDL